MKVISIIVMRSGLLESVKTYSADSRGAGMLAAIAEFNREIVSRSPGITEVELAECVAKGGYSDDKIDIFMVTSALQAPKMPCPAESSTDDLPCAGEQEYIVTVMVDDEETYIRRIQASMDELWIRAKYTVSTTPYSLKAAGINCYVVGRGKTYLCYLDIYESGYPVILDIVDAKDEDDARRQAGGRVGELAEQCYLIEVHKKPYTWSK